MAVAARMGMVGEWNRGFLIPECPCSQTGLEAHLLWHIWPFSGPPCTPHH